MGKGLLGPNGGSGGMIEGKFGEHYGGNDGIGGSKFGVGEGKVVSMDGIGGGAFAIHSIVSKDGRGGEGLVVDGGRSSRVSRKAWERLVEWRTIVLWGQGEVEIGEIGRGPEV
ncbi:hypothetical protein Tco_1467763 [Tanacetum coccineum]